MPTTLADRRATTNQPCVVVFSGTSGISVELAEFGDTSSGDEVQLDFSNVEHLTSAELTALIQFRHKMNRVEKRTVLINVAPAVYDLFEMTRFLRLVEVRK